MRTEEFIQNAPGCELEFTKNLIADGAIFGANQITK
jgi:hypothetical protein